MKPWIDYAIELAEKEETAAEHVAMAKDPIRIVFDVLPCLREISSATYSEGPAAVTHFEWHFEDLK